MTTVNEFEKHLRELSLKYNKEDKEKKIIRNLENSWGSTA